MKLDQLREVVVFPLQILSKRGTCKASLLRISQTTDFRKFLTFRKFFPRLNVTYMDKDERVCESLEYSFPPILITD